MSEYFKTDHGGDVYGKRDIVDFSASINPLGQPDSVRRALNSCADACLYYPDIRNRDLRAAVAGFEGVPAEWVVCGNGAADLIYRFAFGAKPTDALLLAPTFGEYERALRLVGCRVEYYLLREETGFAVCDDILDSIPANGAVVLCNPNNPTGRMADPVLLGRILVACAERSAWLFVDECFMDFLSDGEEYSLKKKLRDFPRLVVLRAFTKTFAIPGVRLGYALTADREAAAMLENTGPPWNVSVPAQLCGVAAAGERAFVERTHALVRELRAELRAGLEELGLTVFPSDANYLLFKAADPGLGDKLLRRGFQLRTCAGFRGLSDLFFRAAVRTQRENSALLQAIQESLAVFRKE